MGHKGSAGVHGVARERAGPAEHLLRRVGCGFVFVVFGVGAIVLAPAASLAALAHPRQGRALVVQSWVSVAFRTFLSLGQLLHLFSIESEGVDRLANGPAVVVANHPSLLDVVVLIAHMPQADCIVKREAWCNPFLRWIVSVAGYVPNEEGNRLVAECAARLRDGRSLVLFPEGSRSLADGMRPFRRGAAQIALASGCPIRPVLIGCRPRILRKGQPFWEIPNEVVCYSLSVGEDIDVTAFAKGLARPIAAREITRALEGWYGSRAT